jgi:hypothetical protein
MARGETSDATYSSRLWSGPILAKLPILILFGIAAYGLASFPFEVDLFEIILWPIFILEDVPVLGPWFSAGVDQIREDFPPIAGWWFVLVAFFLILLLERVRIEVDGVRYYIGIPALTVLYARWERVSRITLIEHDQRPARLHLQYRTWLGLPMHLTLSSSRLDKGEEAIDRAISYAATSGRPARVVRLGGAVVWVTAWMLIIGGFLAYVGLVTGYLHGVAVYEAHPQPWRDYPPILEPIYAMTLYLASVGLISAGLGRLSVHHMGRPRTLLFMFWLLFVLSHEPIVILSLVHVAILAIWHASVLTLSPPEPLPVIPAWTLTLPMYSAIFGMVVAFLAFYGSSYWTFRGNHFSAVLSPGEGRSPRKSKFPRLLGRARA